MQVDNNEYYNYGKQYANLCKDAKYNEAQKILTNKGFSDGSIFIDGEDVHNKKLKDSFKSFVNGVFGDKNELSIDEMTKLVKGVCLKQSKDPEDVEWTHEMAAKSLLYSFAQKNNLKSDRIFSGKNSYPYANNDSETIVKADTNKDGKIDMQDFAEEAKNLDHCIAENFDFDRNGKISKNEFAGFLTYLDEDINNKESLAPAFNGKFEPATKDDNDLDKIAGGLNNFLMPMNFRLSTVCRAKDSYSYQDEKF